MSQSERQDIILAAQNRTRKAFDELARDLGRVEKKSAKAGRAQSRFGSLSRAACSEASGAMSGLSAKAGALGRVLGSLGPAGLSAAGGIGAVGSAMFKGTMSFAEWDKRMRRTDALLKATGSAAGLSALELERFAKNRDLATLGDRNEIMDAINTLMTFKSIQGETFLQTIALGQDMSATFGQSLKSSVTMLGKALEDPVTGLTALRRVGVTFTEQEKKLIKAMLDANDAAGAQAQILDVLRRQVGGASDAEAGGLCGSLDTLSFRWREFLESVEQTRSFGATVDALAESFHSLAMTIKSVREQKSMSDQLDILDWKIASRKKDIEKYQSDSYQEDMFSDSFGYHIHAPMRDEIVELEKLEQERKKLIESINKAKPVAPASGGTTKGGEGKGTGTETTSSSSEVSKAVQSLSRLRKEVARLSMTDREFAEFELAQKAKELGKVLGETNPELKTYIELAEAEIAKKYEGDGTSVSGLLSDDIASTKEEVKGFFEAWNEGMGNMTLGLESEYSEIAGLASEIGRASGYAMGDMFYDSFTGKLDSAGDYLAAWGQSVTRYLSDILGQQTGKAMLSGFSSFVQGLTAPSANVNAQFSGLRSSGMTGFASGGISYGPQMALVSEGRYPVEAHVPLPDGRKIPVEMSGAAAAPARGPAKLEVQIHNASGQPLQVKNATLSQDPARQVIQLFLEGCSRNIGGVGERLGLTGY